ncbi:glyoxalase I [Diutina catenulata]
MPSIDKSFKMNHTCFRIKDPKVSIPFYEKNFGMKELTHFDFPEMGFTIYMLAYDTPETKGKNWADREGVLELCHNHGSENDDNFTVNNGNGKENRGFGHICMSVDNIEAAEAKMLENGVKFQKKLADGRQKNIAFALDPDGYWIELIENGINKQPNTTDASANYRFNHTMIRVKDPKKSLEFYEKALGMKVLTKKSFEEAKFTLYFLGYNHDGTNYADNREAQAGRQGIIELTHNWGTEDDADFAYHNGNSTENGAIQGYGHTCVSCSDPAKFCAEIEKEFPNVEWGVKFNAGKIKKIAFVKDPDNYSIEIIPSDIFANGNQGYDKL